MGRTIRNAGKSNNVVFKNKFNSVYDMNGNVDGSKKVTRDKHYKSGNKLRYILRDDAIYNFDISIEEWKEIQKLKNENSNLYKLELDKLNDRKNTGLYGKDGVYSQEALDKLFEAHKHLNDKQIIWDTVISFDKEFSELHEINNPDIINKILKKQMPKLLKKMGFKNPDSIEWFYGMHIDTDNPHVHLQFFEKEPTQFSFVLDEDGNQVLNKYGKPKWQRNYLDPRRAVIDTNLMNKFKFDIDKAIQLESYDFEEFNKSQKQLRENFKSNWNEDLDFEEKTKLSWDSSKQMFVDMKSKSNEFAKKVTILKRILKTKLDKGFSTKNLSYGSAKLNNYDRKIVDEVTYLFMESVPNLKEDFNLFVQMNDKKSEYLLQMNWNKYEGKDEDEKIMNTIHISPDDLLKKEKDWDLTDPIQVLKKKKIDFRNEFIKSKDSKGHYQGIIPQFGNKILSSLLQEIKSDKFNGKDVDSITNFNPGGRHGNKVNSTNSFKKFTPAFNKMLNDAKFKSEQAYQKIIYLTQLEEEKFKNKIKQMEI